ncbi:putative phosphatase regulatory subunit-domain-containing protein [Cubamyces lactineus]|nr:putative phosphatase regulatory subunit-domain-containing protein [Cubamyces lactineus]
MSTTVVDLHSYYTTPMDYSCSRHTNSAGAPLPRIPRRSPASRSGSAPSSSTAAAIHSIFATASSSYSPPTTPTALVIHPPTPPRPEPSTSDARSSEQEEATSSSSSSSEAYVQMVNPRSRRVRKPKMNPLRAPADSTPTPAVLKLKTSPQVAFPAQADDTSGTETPRPSKTGRLETSKSSGELTTTFRSEGSGSSRTVSAPQSDAAAVARKKTGEPLKSSLKSRRPVVRGDLSVVTGISSTKSEPSTPMGPKSVHFDAKLEHVKLFLAEQKPLAISREGSPTDTSGTESDFPSSIYGSARDDRMLTMRLTNKPATPPADADIALEDIVLAPEGTALNGTVRVKNLAFEKWVAVRFTVDEWQTTSEVTARYSESLMGGVYDRFVFTIRLGDMLARIEDKTLFCALRYNVAGREIWDNNATENYKVTFAKVPRPSAGPSASTSADSGLASLKSKLESVVQGRETVGGYVAHAHGRKARAESFTLEASTSLSARYDFAASLRNPWTRSTTAAIASTSTPVASGSGMHSRNSTYPHTLPQFTRRGVPSKTGSTDTQHTLTRGSPRILDAEDDTPTFRTNFNAELEDTPVPVLSRRRSGRNHQRGYFDLGYAHEQHFPGASVKRTPPGTPGVPASSPRMVGALSPMAIPRSARTPEQYAQGWYVERGGSEESTPSATSTSESSRSNSPSGSPVEDPLMYSFMAEAGDGGVRSPVESDSYNVFLNKYCYFTGATDPFLDVATAATTAATAPGIHRSHSASSVEEFLSSPNPGYMLAPGETPARSPSFDDVVSMSGASTPTARSVARGMGMSGLSGVGMVGAASPPLLSIAH